MGTSNCIQQTIQWVEQIVIKNNFCPFAAAELLRQRIRFNISPGTDTEAHLETLAQEWRFLDQHPDTATTLLILPEAYPDFMDYLDFINLAGDLLHSLDYEGVYQLASFHPLYRFAGSTEEDPANYTNRSPYAMVHVLREEQLEQVLHTYQNPENIPLRNIDLARKLGLHQMQEDRLRSME